MKKITFFAITFSVFMLSFVLPRTVNAQADTITYQGHLYARLLSVVPESNLAEASDPVTRSEMAMKESSVHIRAVRDFKKRYSNALNQVWLATPKGYAVQFNDEGVSTTVRYSNNGHWIHTMKRYQEASLPQKVRAIFKPVYYDYTVVVVYEISESASQQSAFFIHLKENRNYKVIRVANGEMDEIQSFQLQKG